MAFTTIRRNTKAHAAAIAAARNIRVYSEANYFNGAAADRLRPYDVENGKLYRKAVGFQLHVHSNLWYEWEG